jgi:hypothetical protein
MAVALLCGPSIAAQPADHPARPSVLTVIGCSGTYAHIDLAHGGAVESGELAMIAPDHRHVDGCLFDGGAYDPATGVLYGLFPKEARVDREERRHYKVVAIDPASMSELSHVDVPGLSDGDLRIGIVPSTRRVEVGEDGRVVSMSGGRDRPLKIEEERHGAPSKDASAAEALPSPSGLGLLDAGTPKRFESILRAYPENRRLASVLRVDAARGRALYVVAPDAPRIASTRASALVVYDDRAKRIVSAFDSRFVVSDIELSGSSAHLSPDGQRVIVEEYQRRVVPDRPDRAPQMLKSGRLAIYDANTGTLQSLVSLRPGADFSSGELVSYSDDGQWMYYRWDHAFHVVDLAAGRLLASAPIDEPIELVTVTR